MTDNEEQELDEIIGGFSTQVRSRLSTCLSKLRRFLCRSRRQIRINECS
jgi:hypothetical protein